MDGGGLGVAIGRSVGGGVRVAPRVGVPVGWGAAEKDAGGNRAGVAEQFGAPVEPGELVSEVRSELAGKSIGVSVPAGDGTAAGAPDNSGVLSSIS